MKLVARWNNDFGFFPWHRHFKYFLLYFVDNMFKCNVVGRAEKFDLRGRL